MPHLAGFAEDASVRRYLVAALALLALQVTGATAAPAGVPHGGAGIVRANGSVGRLRVGRSSAGDVQRFAGRPNYRGIGAFRSGGVVPRFLALGYGCWHVQEGGIPTARDDGRGTRHTQPSGIACITVYFVMERTKKLELFTSRSPRVHDAARYASRDEVVEGA